MSDEFQWRLLVPSALRDLPADLAAVTGLTVGTIVVVLAPILQASPLRVVLGLPFVLFLPGYAFVAALFPEAGESIENGIASGDDPGMAADRSGIDGIERIALSFGLSIAVVPLIGLVLNFTPFGIRLLPVLVAVAGFTLVMVAVATHRRRSIPSSDRFRVPYKTWLRSAWTEFTSPGSRLDGVLNVLLVVSVLLAAGSVTYAVAVPKQGEAFTESYLLTEHENGTLVADNYPTEFTAGEPKPIVVGISNHEHESVTYTMVVEIQRVTTTNNTTSVLADREIRRFTSTIEDGNRIHRKLNLTPRMTGTRLRLAFLLYKDSPPANPTIESAYRETHLWVNVTQPANQTSALPGPAKLVLGSG